MNSPPWSTIALLALVAALAGCSMPFDGPLNQSPSATETPGTADPPGVTNGTLDDQGALLAAHSATLRETGFRLEERTADSRTTYAAASNFTSFRVVPGPNNSNPAIWANETLTLAQLTRENETVYQRPPRFWASRSQMTAAESLRILFNASTYARNGTERCGDRRCTVLTAAGSPRFQNFTAEATVDESGVVHRFHATYTRSNQNRTGTAEYRLNVTHVGETSVERPPWVSTAIDETG